MRINSPASAVPVCEQLHLIGISGHIEIADIDRDERIRWRAAGVPLSSAPRVPSGSKVIAMVYNAFH
jgi:hypothetical protein